MDAPIIEIERLDGAGADNPRFRIDGSRWVLLAGGLENFDGIDHGVSVVGYAQYDGCYVAAERSPEIDRTIECVARSEAGEARAEAEAFFIPHRRYAVHVEWMGRRRACEGVQYGLRLSTDLTGAQRVTWTALCPDPYWRSDDDKRFDITRAPGNFGFPFRSFRASSWASDTHPTGRAHDHISGMVPGVRGKTIRMVNGGTSTAYPRFEIAATGEVENPRVVVEDERGEEVCRVSFTCAMKKGTASSRTSRSARPRSRTTARPRSRWPTPVPRWRRASASESTRFRGAPKRATQRCG